MNDVAQTVVVVAVILLGGLLVVRLLFPVLAWIRRTLRPETRAFRVVGIGGGGSNAVDRMVAARIPGVTFVACNTDAQALRLSRAGVKVRIGEAITRGLGSGGDPDVGRRSAEEDEAKIAHTLADADLVFITAGLGGGTGSGAAPVVGASARAQGALTIAVVTKPFAFEGAHRRRIADSALADLAASVDAIITIPNDRVAEVVADDTSMLAAFRVVDDVLLQAVRGIIELLSGPGLINLDFADVRAVMVGAGPTIIGLGSGSGENRAIDAARQAIASPLLEASIQGARGILFNIAGPPDLRLNEVRMAADEIRASADPDANVIFGASLTRPAGEDVVITLIATGLASSKDAEVVARPTTHRTLEPKIVNRQVGPIRPADAGVPMNGGPKRAPKVEAPSRSRGLPSAGPAVAEPVTSSERRPSESPPVGEVDLEVPSFLRRRQPS